jgi:hypothetical protein
LKTSAENLFKWDGKGNNNSKKKCTYCLSDVIINIKIIVKIKIQYCIISRKTYI